jgi:hypothetical protein
MHIQAILKRTVGAAVLISGCAAFAQQTQIPFKQIQRDAQSSTASLPSKSDLASVVAPESASGESSSSAASLPAAPSPASSSSGLVAVYTFRPPKVVDTNFLLLNSQHLILALADIEMSQRCIDAHTCTEANPLMPNSLAAKFGVNLAVFANATFGSYYLKKHGSRYWWLPPVSGAGIHAVGLTSGLAH